MSKAKSARPKPTAAVTTVVTGTLDTRVASPATTLVRVNPAEQPALATLVAGVKTELTQNSLVNILSQKLFTAWESELAHAGTEVELRSEALSGLEEQLADIVAATPTRGFADKLDAIVLAFKAAGVKKASAEVTIGALDRKAQTVALCGLVSVPTGEKGYRDRRSTTDTPVGGSVPLAAAGKALLAEIARVDAERTKFVKLAEKMRRNLADKDSTEKLLLAQVDASIARATDDGAVWLDALSATVDSLTGIDETRRRLQIEGR
jgi:hypothetical protein